MSGDDGIASLIATLQADSGVPAYWDGRYGVTDVAGEADRWAVSHEDNPGVPDLVATSAAARPVYDGEGLTFNAVDTRMVTVADAALDVLGGGGSLLMLGSMTGGNNTLLAGVRNASARYLELGAGGAAQPRSWLNTIGGQASLAIADASGATRLAFGAAFDTLAGELACRAMNKARVTISRSGAILAEEAHVELGARTGGLFGGGVINAIALLTAPFTVAQMEAWRDFGIAQFGISTLP